MASMSFISARRRGRGPGAALAPVALALLTAPARAEPPALDNAPAGERSPYLSDAASQPVHWQPWGERVFEAARRLRRPLLLDIGAA